MEQKLFDMITGYKKTIAIQTAVIMNLPRYLREPVRLIELSQVLKADKDILVLFLLYLEGMGLVSQEDGYWKLPDNLTYSEFLNFSSIAEHEFNVMKKWNTSENLLEALHKGSLNRKIMKKGFSNEDQWKYFKAMNNKNLKLLLLWSIRECKEKESVKYLEWGRSGGFLSYYLLKKYPKAACSLQIWKDFENILKKKPFPYLKTNQVQILPWEAEVAEETETYDFIHIYNTIHYIGKKELIINLKSLKERMNNTSVMCIADIFLDSGNREFLLDWITHGGIHSLYLEELKKLLENCGLEVYKTKYLEQVYLDLVFIRKKP